jgi:hypothetical protein
LLDRLGGAKVRRSRSHGFDDRRRGGSIHLGRRLAKYRLWAFCGGGLKRKRYRRDGLGRESGCGSRSGRN